jgi:phosphoenolpyruvate carboxylase
VNVAVSPYGEILTYSNPAPAIFAVDDNGVDVLSQLSSVDGNYYEGYNGSYITLNFGDELNVSQGAKLVLRTDAYLVKDSIHIQVQNENGQWKDIASVIPRAYWSTDIIDMSNYLPSCSNTELKVRLYFTANHKIDYVGLDTTSQASVKTYEANLTSAIHSTQGNVKPLLMKNDQTYAELIPGEQIQLTFRLPNNQNQERTFILYAEGHYSTIAP